MDITPSRMENQLEGGNCLSETFERLRRKHAQVIHGDVAIRKLNELQFAFQGIAACTQLVIANQIAEETCQPSLNPGHEYGLLVAANSLANFAITSIDDLADWADDRLEKDGGAHA